MIRTFGPETMETATTTRDHLSICDDLDLADFDAARVVSGSKFVYLKNEAARMELASIANKYYKESEKGIESFSSESRIAIKACIELYGKLNDRIISRGNDIKTRESLSWSEKLGALPSSKYWKLPIAYLKS